MAGVGLQVEESLRLGVGDSDRPRDSCVNDFFERLPGLVQRDVLDLYLGVLGILPPCLFAVSLTSIKRSIC